MAREELERASEHLRLAMDEADSTELRDRLANQAEQLDRFATADRGPDHGRLARHEHVLSDVTGSAGEAVAEHVGNALAAVREYRKTVDGI